MSLGELVFRPFVGRDEIRAPLKTLAWKASIRRGVPPKPSNLALLKTKIAFFATLYKQETLFYKPDLFRFAYRINY